MCSDFGSQCEGMQGSLLLYGIGLINAIFYNPVHIPQLALSLLAPLISWEPHLNLTSPSVFSCAHGDVYIDLGWLDQFENRRPAWITTGVCKIRGVPDFYLVLLCGNLTTLWNITMSHSIMKNRASYTLEIFKRFCFSFFYHFGYHCIHHFFIIYFIIFIFLSFFKSCFYHFLNHFSSFFLPVVQKFSKKWKITIFLGFFFIFSFFLIIFASSGGIDEKW